MTLPLHGVAKSVRGYPTDLGRRIFRLQNPNSGPRTPQDVALVHNVDELDNAERAGFTGAVAVSDEPLERLFGANRMPGLAVLPSRFGYLADGDILGMEAERGRFRTLYRRKSNHNSFLVTERCNHYCLMCSQPPRDVDDAWILDEIRSCLPLINKDARSFGFTGGEPLLDWRGFISILGDCRDILPQTAIHVLSNGRAFADNAVTAAWSDVRHPDLMVGIPVYASVDSIHDYVVQARDAFDETVLGILKLKDKGQRVEVRLVLHAITAPHIVETCRWLSRNLPFLDHVALMGLENTGFALANEDALWIDPVDYGDALAEGVSLLAAAGMPVSVYNLPRCVLPRSVWPHAAQSISDWKNGFLAECDNCIEKLRCGGFFTSGKTKFSRGIKALDGAAAHF